MVAITKPSNKLMESGFKSMKLNPTLANLLAPAYAPCSAFSGSCREMRWNPSHGHVPRGFLGAAGDLSEVELVLVFAEPGDPHESETHEGLTSAYSYATYAFETGKDQFHRNVRTILDSCWPGLSFVEQMKKVWMTESVLCSATKEGGSVSVAAANECGRRYLAKQLELLPRVLTVALGIKAQKRLRSIGFTKFLPAFAVAPPGCNFFGAQESWDRIPIELHRKDEAKRRGGTAKVLAPASSDRLDTLEYCVLSVMGPHAGEDSDAIFERKCADIKNHGRTYWVIRSHKARPDMIQTIASAARDKSGEPLCAFLAPSAPGGAIQTKTSFAAAEYSTDRAKWRSLPAGISPVTGQMTQSTCALVFDQLCLWDPSTLDLWQYADFFNPELPVKIRRGASTIGVVRGDTSSLPDRMKSRLRRVMAVGRLVEPFAVWLR